ncbi:hypothetical protein C8D87_105575 [Lentzea atacamensis]|uniref:Uncharacterized protein n=1 Tax=Lentzea atacamensis TaxID=531938 RepID=A0ABX9E6T5_9PSEU|nr:hypothetical protein [Lentzea atacamensis]RAS65080.1 hypothetical protein C8D87_105575 [Lentzea atacamensis]
MLEKHVRQDELVEYVEENLRLIVAGLYDLAGEQAPQPDPVREAAVPSLVAPAEETTKAAMERIGPLRDVLDELTGRPDVIAAHATTWFNIAVAQREMADELEDFIERDVPAWDGAAEHQRLMGHNIEALRGLSWRWRRRTRRSGGWRAGSRCTGWRCTPPSRTWRTG